ncbi:unnamed protein product [Orchesella dallaii]|uniref:Uncharacterized protein n=1 Tax=Orchesella dallaii TaxID=48710 RepID=A0ABP1R9B2_9HEXA
MNRKDIMEAKFASALYWRRQGLQVCPLSPSAHQFRVELNSSTDSKFKHHPSPDTAKDFELKKRHILPIYDIPNDKIFMFVDTVNDLKHACNVMKCSEEITIDLEGGYDSNSEASDEEVFVFETKTNHTLLSRSHDVGTAASDSVNHVVSSIVTKSHVLAKEKELDFLEIHCEMDSEIINFGCISPERMEIVSDSDSDSEESKINNDLNNDSSYQKLDFESLNLIPDQELIDNWNVIRKLNLATNTRNKLRLKKQRAKERIINELRESRGQGPVHLIHTDARKRRQRIRKQRKRQEAAKSRAGTFSYFHRAGEGVHKRK